MIFLSAQPWDPYFQWQIEVQICNFRKHGISDKMHILVWYPPEGKLDGWKKIAEKYPEVKIFTYPDKGVDLNLYIPQLRPHIIKEHFKVFPKLSQENIFYHDSDIIFNYLPDFELLLKDDICWQSDCSGYLDYSYMRRKEQQGNMKEHEGIEIMAQIGDISIDTIKEYDGKTGGAQTILKNVDSDYWQNVEDIAMEIRRKFFFGVPGSINHKYFSSENAGWQSWTCDMWALNFALWNRGKKTDVTPLLAFSWATDSSETYLKKPIYHNAGANGRQSGVFYKGRWIEKSPIGVEHRVTKNSASWYYVQAINDVK